MFNCFNALLKLLYTEVDTFHTMSYRISDIQKWQTALFYVCNYSYYAKLHGVTIEDKS